MEDLIEAYITKAPLEVQGVLRRVRQLVLEVDPELTQTLSYQMPTFKKHNKAVFHFAAQKNHLGIYPTPAAIEYFAARLEGYQTSKGAIQIPYSIPLDEGLIKDLVRFNLDALEDR
jgi:uncharacterized protein YdhG (YjbR/CyaY superfamily)